MKPPPHSLLIFMTGAVILGLELTASRYMSPMFGSSLYIWGAILSVTLLCLSMGYSWGGRLGEKLEKPVSRLILFILIAAAWIGILPFIQRPVALLGISAGSTFGPLLVTTVLFALPILLLATATPLVFAENNRARHGDGAAAMMGDLFAISTVGSVLGALVTAYAMIPILGLRLTLFALSVILIAVTIPHVLRGLHLRTAINIVFVVSLSQLAYNPDPSAGLNKNFRSLHHESSPYAELSVLEDAVTHDRILLIDGASQNMLGGENFDSSLFEYPDVITGQLTQYPSTNKRALMLGLGAGILNRQLASTGYSVESVDIDPAVHRIAKQYFNLDDQLNVTIQDARSFIADAEKHQARYGVVILDIPGGGGQLGYTLDLEALTGIRNIMADDGVLFLNQLAVLASGQNDLARHTIATLRQVFPQVRAFDVYPAESDVLLTNLVTVSSFKPPLDPEFRSKVQESLYDIDVTGIHPITDNWNPYDLWSIQINEKWYQNMAEWLGPGALIPI